MPRQKWRQLGRENQMDVLAARVTVRGPRDSETLHVQGTRSQVFRFLSSLVQENKGRAELYDIRIEDLSELY